MTQDREAPGCRDIAIATGFLLVVAFLLIALGLAMTQQPDCRALCATTGITLLYAGGPVSAVFGVLFGGLVVAWPLDVTLWVVLGFVSAGIAARRPRGVMEVAVAILGLALVYGLVLSQFVEIVI